ncbi:MAG: helix-turn-helix transcriptional regulator [Lysobacteraceae bacterium]
MSPNNVDPAAIPEPARDRIYALWDELTAFDAARSEDALLHLLAGLCAVSSADNAYWLGTVRMAETAPSDPLNGWRPRAVRYLHHHERELQAYADGMKLLEESDGGDPHVLEQVRHAGSFRRTLLRDIAAPSFFNSHYFDVIYRRRGILDAAFVVLPLNADCESYYCLQRTDAGKPLFRQTELDHAAFALRGLGWFQRQLMLSHGLQISNGALTDSERRVLSELLTHKTEKVIAQSLGLSPTTVHSYVRNLYRKFAVNSRAGLAALWLGQGG